MVRSFKPYIEPWEPWYAWHPVRHDGGWLWLCKVWRQGWVMPNTTSYFYMTEREYLIYKLRY